MAVTGYLAEFSLPEIFQLLDQGHKTGLLTIRAVPDAQTQKAQSYYIWLHQGRIVAAANRLDQKGLLMMITQRGWLSDRVATRLAQVFSTNKPMGLCLKSQGLLQAEQLKLLYGAQVLRQVCALFQLLDGQFKFDPKASLPQQEMTGLSMPATEVTLMAMRALKDWRALAHKLPEPTSALVSVITSQPHFRLDALEWQVWEFTNGTMSLRKVAEQLRLPIDKVQQIAFRLIVIGLAEEIPQVEPPASLNLDEVLPEPPEERKNGRGLSQSFFQNLLGFLRSRV